MVSARYHGFMAMTLRLSEEQTEALRREAEFEHRSMQEVVLRLVDEYLDHKARARKRDAALDEIVTKHKELLDRLGDA